MRFSRSFLVFAITFLFCGLFANGALAQTSAPDDEEARRLFRIGQAHYDHGDFTEAATEFESAYAQSHRPELLYNLYLATRDAGDLDRAREALRGYLDALPDADGAAALRARLAVMDRQAESAADDAHGSESTTDDADTTPSTPSPASTEGPTFGRSPVGWIVGGVGAAATIAAIITGVLALDRQSALTSQCAPDGTCASGFEADRDLGHTLAITTDVLGAVGAVGLAVGVTLLFVLDTGGSELRAECGPQRCGAQLTLAF